MTADSPSTDIQYVMYPTKLGDVKEIYLNFVSTGRANAKLMLNKFPSNVAAKLRAGNQPLGSLEFLCPTLAAR